MNDSQNEPSKSKLSFLSGEELAELRGLTRKEENIVRSRLRLADPEYDIFAIPAEIPDIPGMDDCDREQVAGILASILKDLANSGRILRPVAVEVVGPKTFAIFAYDPRKMEALQLLLLRKALAQKLSEAVAAYCDELDTMRQTMRVRGPRPLLG